MNDPAKTISIEDVNTGETVEMAVAGTLTHKGIDYILVYDAASGPLDEAEAVILKVKNETDDDIFYEDLADADELSEIAALFMEMDDDLTIEL